MTNRRCLSLFFLQPTVGVGLIFVAALSTGLFAQGISGAAPKSVVKPEPCVMQIGDSRIDSNRVSIVLEMDSAAVSEFKVIGIENVLSISLQRPWVWQQPARAATKTDRMRIPVPPYKITVSNVVTDTVHLHLVLAFSGNGNASAKRQGLIGQLSREIGDLASIATLVVWLDDRPFQVNRPEGLESLMNAVEESMNNHSVDSEQGALEIISRSIKKSEKGFRKGQGLSFLFVVTNVPQEKLDKILPSEKKTHAKGYSLVRCPLSDEAVFSVDSLTVKREQLAALAASLRDRDSVAVDSVFGDLCYDVRPRRTGSRGSVKDTLWLHLVIALSDSGISARRLEQLIDQFRRPLDSLEEILAPMYSLNDMGGAADNSTLEKSLRSLCKTYARKASKDEAKGVIERSVNIRRLSPRRQGGKDFVLLITDLSQNDLSRINAIEQLSSGRPHLECFLSDYKLGISDSHSGRQDTLDPYVSDPAAEDSAWMSNTFGVLGDEVRQQRPNRAEISWTNDWIVQSSDKSLFEISLPCNQGDTVLDVPVEYDSLYCQRSQKKILEEAAITVGMMASDKINQLMQQVSELISIEECERLLGAVYRRAVTLMENGDESDGLQIIRRLESLFQTDLGWRQNFAAAYLKAARVAAKKNNYSQAVDLAECSFKYEASKESQDLIQEQAGYNNDPDRALNAAKWKYNNVDLTSVQTNKLMNDQADLYADAGDFDRAFQSALKGRQKSDGDSAGIRKAILILKSEWAVLISWFAAQSLGAQSQEANLKDASQLLLNLPEVMTVSLCDANLIPTYRIGKPRSGNAVSSKFEGSMNSGLTTAFAKKKEFAVEFDMSGRFGRAIIPTGGGRYLVTTFSAEGGRDEEVLASQLQTNPNDPKTWSKYRYVLDNVRIETAVRTLGYAFEHPANDNDDLLKLIRLWGSKFPKSASAYEIVNLKSGDSSGVKKLSGSIILDDATLNDSRANLNPNYLKKPPQEMPCETGSLTVVEHTIALYRSGLWVGAFRIGLRERM